VPTTPADRDGCACRLLPRSRGLPRFAGGSASAPLLSRPAQASLTLRPVGLLNRPRRPLSRGFDPVGHPTKPLVSYQSNRQLSGWILPPLVKRALGAHCRILEFRPNGQQVAKRETPVLPCSVWTQRERPKSGIELQVEDFSLISRRCGLQRTLSCGRILGAGRLVILTWRRSSCYSGLSCDAGFGPPRLIRRTL
jgi:hypothetical protein